MGHFARHIHDYLHKQIMLADQKAAFIIVLAGGITAFLFNEGLHRMWMMPITPIGPLGVLSFTAFYFLALGVINAVLAVRPRLSRSLESGETFVSFLAVAQRPSAEGYRAEILKMKPDDLYGELLRHAWDLAVRVCVPKYERLNAAVWLTAAGLALSGLLLLMKP